MRWAAFTLLLAAASAPALFAADPPASLWSDFAWPDSAPRSPALAESLLQIRTQNWAQALTILEARLFEQPQEAGALHVVGLLFWQAGNREESTRRLVRATRAPDHQPISLWALAALSAQAHSQAESVGWVKRASRATPEVETEAWLRKPYFSALCEFPPYRELLAELDLSDLCPTTALATRYDQRRTDPDSMRELLERPAPAPSLRLPVRDAPALQLRPPEEPPAP